MKRRGEVWWINFDPSVGQEIRKRRPAVVISNDSSNRNLKRFQVVPLSSQVRRIYPSEARIRVAGEESKAMADQLTTVSELRFDGRLNVLSPQDLVAVEEAVRRQLGLLPVQA